MIALTPLIAWCFAQHVIRKVNEGLLNARADTVGRIDKVVDAIIVDTYMEHCAGKRRCCLSF
jgi:hypothetical protein